MGACPPQRWAAQETPSEDFGGTLFRQCVEELRLYLPSTFDFGMGDQTTWVSGDGVTRKRIDFVGLPLAWQSRGLAQDSRVERDLDLSIIRPDPFAVPVWARRGLHRRSARHSHRARHSMR